MPSESAALLFLSFFIAAHTSESVGGSSAIPSSLLAQVAKSSSDWRGWVVTE